MKLHIQKIDQSADFDHFVVMNTQREIPFPVVLDVDTRTGEAYLLTNTEKNLVSEDVWSGRTQRFVLPIVPTPWSAQEVLEMPYVVQALQELIDNAGMERNRKDHRACSDVIAGVENALERACESVLGILTIEAQGWFRDYESRDIYNLYDFSSKGDREIIAEIEKEWHGCCIDGEYVLYITDIDTYVQDVRENIEGDSD